MSTNPVKIGIAGLGNVGEEVARQILNGFRVKNEICPLELVCVSYKSRSKKRNLEKLAGEDAKFAGGADASAEN